MRPLLRTWISWIGNYINYNVWDEITYPFPNFNGCTVDVWEWISNFILHIIGHVMTYPCWDLSYTMIVKGAHGSKVTIVLLAVKWSIPESISLHHDPTWFSNPCRPRGAHRLHSDTDGPSWSYWRCTCCHYVIVQRFANLPPTLENWAKGYIQLQVALVLKLNGNNSLFVRDMACSYQSLVFRYRFLGKFFTQLYWYLSQQQQVPMHNKDCDIVNLLSNGPG